MKVLSLFDGMACGMLAMKSAGVEVERYVAYEIDKYAIKTAQHNFPMIEEKGDVFTADFSQYKGFDYLVGGSPCTYWSIAQKNNRETEASGLGWELFSQYVRALNEAKPKYFIYKNNKSMSKAIRDSIRETFGFEEICINSALVSAQNRQRYYWVGKRNLDGTYSRVDVEQPEDRGILLKDILEDSYTDKDKAYCLKHQAGNSRDYFKKHHTNVKFEPVENKNISAQNLLKHFKTIEQKSNVLSATSYKGIGNDGMVTIAEPVRVPEYGKEDKSRPVRMSYAYKGSGEGSLNTECFSENPCKQKSDYVSEPVKVGCMPSPDGSIKNAQANRVYATEGKSVNLVANGGGAGAKTGLYAIPVEFENNIPTKAISLADGKTHQVYKVEAGQITIKGKQYPIKLADGFYIIRKLTVRECMRLQTVPEWYDFSCVSNTQAYKMLGNGWTVEVISHLIKSALNKGGN